MQEHGELLIGSQRALPGCPSRGAGWEVFPHRRLPDASQWRDAGTSSSQRREGPAVIWLPQKPAGSDSVPDAGGERRPRVGVHVSIEGMTGSPQKPAERTIRVEPSRLA